MDKLHGVEKALEILEKEGEKTFTFAVRKKLEKIKELNKFDVSSFQEFYTDTFHVIDEIVKISPQTQHQVLKYKNGKETIQLLNSFLKKTRDLKKILAKRYSEYSIVNHFENALKKHKEIEELVEKIGGIENKIESVIKEEKHTEELLEEKIKNLQTIELKIRNENIAKLEKQISSLDNKIRTIKSNLKMNLLNARRPISKILHSKRDKKLFVFFKKFIDNPLENINEDFWKIISILKNENLNKNENRSINEFLKFVENKLNDIIVEYKNLEIKKKKLKGTVEELSLKNKEVLGKFEKEKNDTEEKLRIIHKRLSDLKKEKKSLDTIIRKNVKALEIILKKVSDRKIKIKLKLD